MRKVILSTVVLSLLFFSCHDDDMKSNEPSVSVAVASKTKVEVMEEFAKLLGNVLINTENKAYLVNLIHDRNDGSEAITVNTLLGYKQPVSEMNLIKSSRKMKLIGVVNSFKEALIAEVESNLNEYAYLKAELKKSNINSKNARTIKDTYDEVVKFYASQNLDVYFPYQENFDLSKEQIVTLTWDPLVEQDWNRGYTVDHIHNLKAIDKITDDYANENPTLIVRPATTIENAIIPASTTKSKERVTAKTTSLPNWAHTGWQGLLTFNVDHTKIKDEDVLRVSIPKVRLTEHLGTFLTPTTITLVRSNAILETNSLGNLIEPLKSQSFHVIKRQHVKRSDARNRRWVDMNATWDDDWNMHESTHYLTFASHHTFAGSVKVSGDVGLSYDKTTKKVVPNLDIKFKITDGTTIGSNIRVRHNNEVSRRAVLTQIVGDVGHGTFDDNGTPYAIRTAGQLQFYFKPYLTKIVD